MAELGQAQVQFEFGLELDSLGFNHHQKFDVAVVTKDKIYV